MLAKLSAEYEKAKKDGDIERMRAIVNAQIEITEAIYAVPDGQEDPDRLQAVIWAVNQLGSTQFALSSSHDNGQTVATSAGQNKCNIFVAEAYAIGAGVGFGGFGYPVNPSWRHPLTAGNVPAANTLASNELTAVQNFIPIIENAPPPLGAILSFANPSGGSGHTGISIGGNATVHAAADGVKVDANQALVRRLMNDYKAPPSSISVRRYITGPKP